MPIFLVLKNSDIYAFRSIRDAEQWMESPDILEGEYIGAFDEQGNVFSIETLANRPSKTVYGSVTIYPGILKATGVKDASRLYEALHLRFAGGSTGGKESLEELVSRAMKASDDKSAASSKLVKKVIWLLYLMAALFALALYKFN